MNPRTQTSRSRRAAGQISGRKLTPSAADAGRVVDRLGFGFLVTDPEGVVQDANETARRAVVEAFGRWPENASCCSLFGCNRYAPLDQHCIARLAMQSDEPLAELRVGLPAEHPVEALWITAARSDDGSHVLMHLRPAPLHDRRVRSQPHWELEPQLQIQALGRTHIELGGISLNGDWLMQRPGQLLKYLICSRGRPVHVDEIVEALWPEARRSGRSTVRYFVHALRERLEPGRAARAPSAFITSTKSTYSLDPGVVLDVDEFEALAALTLQPASPPPPEMREDEAASLRKALDLYRGDLFSEEPFAEWAFPERERLRTLAHQALSGLVEHYRAAGDAALASRYLERCIGLWPLDSGLHESLIGIYVEQGRHGDAERRYAAFRKRMRDFFGQEPAFRLTDFSQARTRD